MRIQFHEEQAHAFKFFDFVYDRGGVVELQPIEGPPVLFNSPIEVFEKTLAHEQLVTGHIHDLYELALEEKDYPSQVLLQWFIDEQVEEEKNAGDILDMLKMVEGNSHALLMLDRERIDMAQLKAAIEGDENLKSELAPAEWLVLWDVFYEGVEFDSVVPINRVAASVDKALLQADFSMNFHIELNRRFQWE